MRSLALVLTRPSPVSCTSRVKLIRRSLGGDCSVSTQKYESALITPTCRYFSLPVDVRSGASPSATPDRLGPSLTSPSDPGKKKGWGGWKNIVGSAVKA